MLLPRCGPVLLVPFDSFVFYGEGVLSFTRRPTSALSRVPPCALHRRFDRAGEAGVFSGPLVLALTFPGYADYF